MKRSHVDIPAPCVQVYDRSKTRPSGKDTRKSMKSYTDVACAALSRQIMSKRWLVKKLGCLPRSTLVGEGVLW